MRCCAHQDIGTAKTDDNAEEGIKLRNRTERAPKAFWRCHRKSIAGILLVLYLTVPGSGIDACASPQQAPQDQTLTL
jgi:hypothetical protein